MAAIRFKHISISATNLEESLRFHEEMFGLERIPTYNFGFRRQYLRCGAHQLHIFELEDAVPVRQHFALDLDDFTAVYRAAKAQGRARGGRPFVTACASSRTVRCRSSCGPPRGTSSRSTGLMSARSIGGIFRSQKLEIACRRAARRGRRRCISSTGRPRAGVRDAPGWRRRRRFGLV
ncbi:MAG: hypothetical protein K0S35_3418 [Geminicoccaceae bacterium]|jgi:hypothetical protein|nr:hypothetical protein [Geminicoccaceae bacterium]